MKRIQELDFLKGILILLVISFHLVYFEQLYPYAKQVVYTFHMPGFLLISGYLMNVSKPPRAFLRTLLWLAVPYTFMEGGYIIMASLLPINDHIDHLTAGVFLDRLILHPLGPPWYFHTLIICGGIYYIIQNSKLKTQNSKNILPKGRWGVFLQLLLMGIAYYAVSYVLSTLLPLKGVGGTFSFFSALYFLAGAAIHQSGKDFLSIFWASPFALLLFALLIIPHFSLYTFHFLSSISPSPPCFGSSSLLPLKGVGGSFSSDATASLSTSSPPSSPSSASSLSPTCSSTPQASSSCLSRLYLA